VSGLVAQVAGRASPRAGPATWVPGAVYGPAHRLRLARGAEAGEDDPPAMRGEGDLPPRRSWPPGLVPLAIDGADLFPQVLRGPDGWMECRGSAGWPRSWCRDRRTRALPGAAAVTAVVVPGRAASAVVMGWAIRWGFGDN
jgi:hypothetical protein